MYLYAPPSVQERMIYDLSERQSQRVAEMKRYLKKVEEIIDGGLNS